MGAWALGAWLLTQLAACACTLMVGGGVVKANACRTQGATVPPAMQSPSELWQLATFARVVGAGARPPANKTLVRAPPATARHSPSPRRQQPLDGCAWDQCRGERLPEH